jgi:trimeric autotransporter adhesin
LATGDAEAMNCSIKLAARIFCLAAFCALFACGGGGGGGDTPLGVAVITQQQAYVKASNTGTGDLFGSSTAMSSDGNTLAVGAPGEASNATVINGNQADNSAAGAGAVYVFARTGTTWTQQAYIKASNADDGDSFGLSVALSGDGNTLVVGAPGEDGAATVINGVSDEGATNAGAVYVFVRSGTNWAQQAYVKASNTEAADGFGSSVALNGDGNTLVVGAPGEDGAGTGINGTLQADNNALASGAVYVFTRSVATWTQQAYVKASNTEADDGFGSSVALTGDGNTLVVGAPGEDSAGTGINGTLQADNSASAAGASYVFTRSGATWTQQAYVKASNAGTGDQFGVSVAVSSDGNTLAVGAFGEDSAATGIGGNQTDNSASNAGAAYVFTRTGTLWTQQAYVKASNTGVNDQFGFSVALSGNSNALAVGAFGEASAATGLGGNQADDSAFIAGAIYLFTRTGALWTQRVYVKASNAEVGDSFGRAVALSADGSTLAGGARTEASATVGIGGTQNDNSAPNAGAVYVFH